MKVSIITVVYNNADTVRDTIVSVLGQDYEDIQYIVIDGGSDDGTLDILREYEDRIDTCISEPDDGIYHAMNKGVAQASGDIIGFLNADDLLEADDTISNLVNAFKETGSEIVYGDNLYVDREKPSKVIRTWKPGPYRRERFEKGWMPPHMATYFRKELFERYGTFDPAFCIVADYELMFRFMYIHSASAAYIPSTISRMRVGGISNRTFFVIFKSSWQVYKSWKKHNRKVSPLIMIRKPLSKIPQYLSALFHS